MGPRSLIMGLLRLGCAVPVQANVSNLSQVVLVLDAPLESSVLTPALGVDSDHFDHPQGDQVFEEFRIDENLQRVNELAVRCSGGLYAQPETVLRAVRVEVVFAAAGAKIPSATAARTGVFRQAAARAQDARPFLPWLIAQDLPRLGPGELAIAHRIPPVWKLVIGSSAQIHRGRWFE
jgi:hypothetical protein